MGPTPTIETADWQTFVADAVAKKPEERTEAEREAIATAISLLPSAIALKQARQSAEANDELLVRRLQIADEIYETFDFGYDVEDGSGWEYTMPGDEFVKPLFFVNDEDPSGPSMRGHLTVRFEPSSANVAEDHAVVNGVVVDGRRGPRP